MRHSPYQRTRFFFATQSLPCPYLPDQIERRVVTELVGRNASELHDQLSLAGFRRSHGIVYAPACPFCEACMAVRIRASDFQMSKSQRRILNRNRELSFEEVPAVATSEQFGVFSDYQNIRHGDGDMARMDFRDYQALIEETPVESFVGEFRRANGGLVGAILVDRVAGGLSAVYSFFDSALSRQSLGTLMVLRLVEAARQQALDYVYLGFWVAGSPKMAYKANFHPLEVRASSGWVDFKSLKRPRG